MASKDSTAALKPVIYATFLFSLVSLGLNGLVNLFVIFGEISLHFWVEKINLACIMYLSSILFNVFRKYSFFTFSAIFGMRSSEEGAAFQSFEERKNSNKPKNRKSVQPAITNGACEVLVRLQEEGEAPPDGVPGWHQEDNIIVNVSLPSRKLDCVICDAMFRYYSFSLA